MKKTAKSLASKIQVDDVIDIADKNRERIEKLQTFYVSCLYGRRYFDNDRL